MKTLYNWHDVAKRTEIVYDRALKCSNQSLIERLSRYVKYMYVQKVVSEAKSFLHHVTCWPVCWLYVCFLSKPVVLRMFLVKTLGSIFVKWINLNLMLSHGTF